jgi:acyl carrier protein
VEEKLVEIWSAVLKRAPIGIRDDFFELGGHSLLATQLISRIRSAFNVELPLRRLFESPTVAELASAVVEFEKKAEMVPPLRITRGIGRNAQDLLSKIDQLTDDQVDSLLNEALAEQVEPNESRS